MKLLLVLCAESGHTQCDFVAAAVAKQGLYYTLSFVDCSLFVVMAKNGSVTDFGNISQCSAASK